MLPFSNLVPMMQYCAERFLYLPLVGWILALGSLALLLPRRAVFITGTVVLVGWSAIAWQRSWIWRDPLTLFVQTHLEGPTSPRVRDNAVSAAFDLPHMQRVFRRVKEPGRPPTISTVADSGHTPVPWPLIEATLTQLHQIFPDDGGVISAQAITYALQGRPAEAIPFFELAARQHPKLISSWNNLSQACLAAGRNADAEQASQRALALDANDVPSLEQLAAIQWRRKDFSAARATYERLSVAVPANREFASRAAEAGRQLTAFAEPSR
jgi:tetratricopeptide (TPR) repeat protein